MMIKILTSYHADKLTDYINEAQTEGWTRSGDLIVNYRPIPESERIIGAGVGMKCSEFHFTQVMTKE